jgi:hypothetical protein
MSVVDSAPSHFGKQVIAPEARDNGRGGMSINQDAGIARLTLKTGPMAYGSGGNNCSDA